MPVRVSVPFPIKIDSLIKLAIGSPRVSWGRHQGEGGERPRPRLETDVVRNPTKLRRNQAPESYLLRTEAGDYSNILQPLTFPSSILSAEFPQNSRLLKWFQLHHQSPTFCQLLSLVLLYYKLDIPYAWSEAFDPSMKCHKKKKGKNCHALKL